MGKVIKLTDALTAEMCRYVLRGLPAGRAAALCGVHRITVQRWLSQGAAEIAAAGDDDSALGPRARFVIGFEGARAIYLLGLSDAWKAAVARRDAGTATAVLNMLSIRAPDEFGDRRLARGQGID